MDLPSACPYCDSERVHYAYLPHDGAATVAIGTIVFSCTECGSHVESPITDFQPPADDSQWAANSIPAQRLQPHGQLDDHLQRPSTPRQAQSW